MPLKSTRGKWVKETTTSSLGMLNLDAYLRNRTSTIFISFSCKNWRCRIPLHSQNCFTETHILPMNLTRCYHGSLPFLLNKCFVVCFALCLLYILRNKYAISFRYRIKSNKTVTNINSIVHSKYCYTKNYLFFMSQWVSTFIFLYWS